MVVSLQHQLDALFRHELDAYRLRDMYLVRVGALRVDDCFTHMLHVYEINVAAAGRRSRDSVAYSTCVMRCVYVSLLVCVCVLSGGWWRLAIVTSCDIHRWVVCVWICMYLQV